MNYRPATNTPPVITNLIIINALMLLATYVLQRTVGVDLTDILGMHYPASEKFRFYQIITHMFMHGGFMHLFFNMFALWMFGRILENVWGPKRFLIYYFVTGLGAVALHMLVTHIEIGAMQKAAVAFSNTPDPELLEAFVNKYLGKGAWPYAQNVIQSYYDNPSSTAMAAQGEEIIRQITNRNIDIPTVGASGAVYGVLLAFGMLFPNTQLMLIFPPIPIKAKYVVIAYGLLEIYLGFTNSGGSVAHFAHLGGMIFGFFLIRYWRKHAKTFY